MFENPGVFDVVGHDGKTTECVGGGGGNAPEEGVMGIGIGYGEGIYY